LILTEIGQGLRLESLTLASLTDTLEEWALGVQSRMLFDEEGKRWEDKPGDYAAYYYDRIHCVLLGEEIH
jgi:hypothetical protein